MHSRAVGQLLVLAVKAHLPDLLLQRVALVRRVTDQLVRMVNAEHVGYFEVALGQLPLQLGRPRVRVILVVAV